MGPPIPVIPAQAIIQGHTHKSRLPPWTPDQVRGDDVSDKRALTLRSAASRRGSRPYSPSCETALSRLLRMRIRRFVECAGGYPGAPAPFPCCFKLERAVGMRVLTYVNSALAECRYLRFRHSHRRS